MVASVLRGVAPVLVRRVYRCRPEDYAHTLNYLGFFAVLCVPRAEAPRRDVRLLGSHKYHLDGYLYIVQASQSVQGVVVRNLVRRDRIAQFSSLRVCR